MTGNAGRLSRNPTTLLMAVLLIVLLAAATLLARTRGQSHGIVPLEGSLRLLDAPYKTLGSSAYGASASGLVSLAPTAQVICNPTCHPASGSASAATVSVKLGLVTIVQVSALNGHANVNTPQAMATASASVASASIGGIGTNAAVSIGAVTSQCSVDASTPDLKFAGGATVAFVKVGGVAVTLPASGTVNVGVISITVNQQTRVGDTLTVNGLVVSVAGVEVVTLAQSVCDP